MQLKSSSMNSIIQKSCHILDISYSAIDRTHYCSPRTLINSIRSVIPVLYNRSIYTLSNLKSMSSAQIPNIVNNPSSTTFAPKKALVLGKFSRYEFEKHRNPHSSEEELIHSLESRGSDYKSLLYHHNIHIKNRDHIAQCLKNRNIETKVVNRFGYTEELINWADMVITSGGDGTFLLAASKVKNSKKPLIGVNSDPTRSVGYLCLPKKFSDRFDDALDMMLNGQFEWQFRQRIRVILESQNASIDPIELHDQQLLYPEFRFLELEQIKKPNVSPNHSSGMAQKRILPFRALNEVFIGESLSSRVSYFEMSINEAERFKIKSSGVTICTGTGSTSWSFNINKLTPQCVENLFEIINDECFPSNAQLSAQDSKLIQKITERFNNSLIYSPSKLAMAYTIRDPVVFGTNFQSKPRDFANKIAVKSRMTDAHIVIDGGLSYPFNDGAKATFEMHEEDALRTIKLNS